MTRPKGTPNNNKGKKLGPNPAHSARMKGKAPWNKGLKGVQIAWNKGLSAPWAKNLPQQYKKGHTSPRKGKPYPQHRGERNNHWKGGITPLVQTIRQCFKYRQWRSDIFTRDNFTCVWCDTRGGRLNVDHIKAFSLIFQENKIINLEQALSCEEFWNINNGHTLCEPCHKKTDNYGFRRLINTLCKKMTNNTTRYSNGLLNAGL